MLRCNLNLILCFGICFCISDFDHRIKDLSDIRDSFLFLLIQHDVRPCRHVSGFLRRRQKIRKFSHRSTTWAMTPGFVSAHYSISQSLFISASCALLFIRREKYWFDPNEFPQWSTSGIPSLKIPALSGHNSITSGRSGTLAKRVSPNHVSFSFFPFQLEFGNLLVHHGRAFVVGIILAEEQGKCSHGGSLL